MILLVDNTYNGEILVEKGEFKTIKHIKKNHGLGLKSIEKILKKYNGYMKINYTEEIFSVSVILPCTY
ncbi:MAG: GHKL domain-containing protein [Lachnospirales bacterium]